jgi:hypothetical protein
MFKIVFNKLFISQWTGYSFLLGIITGVLAYFLNIPYLYPLAFVLITNAFDLTGYGNIQQVISEYDTTIYRVTIPYYRIIQKLFNFTLAGLIWSITDNWIIAVACLCANFGGFQDLLYYIFGRYNLNQNYTWLKWTPYGYIIWKLYGRGLDKYITIKIWKYKFNFYTEFILQGIISFGMVITVLYFLL